MRTSIWMGMLCVIGTASVLAACGDTEETSATNTISSSSSSASGGGQGGTSSSSASSSSSAGGAGGQGQGGATGSGGGGGQGGGSSLINGCDSAMAEDHTADAMVTIDFGGPSLGNTYSPECIRVKAGTDVTFSGNFAFHPLQGGTVMGMVATPDPTSPIQNPSTPMAMSATFTLANPGDYPYYCTAHGLTGMTGAIFVVP